MRIRASNTGGTSAPSNEDAVVVGCTAAPGPPTGLRTVVNGGGTLQIAWDAPDFAGTSNGPTAYIFEAGSFTGMSDLTVLDVGPATTASFTGIQSGTYYVRVRAKNPCAIGQPSSEFVLVVP